MFKQLVICLTLCYHIIGISTGSISSTPGKWKCPPKSLVKPCSCDAYDFGMYLICTFEDIDYKQYFERLSRGLPEEQYHMDSFTIQDAKHITVLGNGTFGNITFNSISIHSCDSLTTIEPEFFGTGNQRSVTRLTIDYNSRLGSGTGSKLFDIVNRFEQLETVDLSWNDIREIPDRAFKRHPKLRWLVLDGHFTQLGDRAFQDMPDLTHLSIGFATIDVVPRALLVIF